MAKQIHRNRESHCETTPNKTKPFHPKHRERKKQIYIQSEATLLSRWFFSLFSSRWMCFGLRICGMCLYNIVYRHTSFGSPGFFSSSSSFLLLSFRPSLPLFVSLLFGSFSLLLLFSDWFAVGTFAAIAVAMVDGRTGGVGNIILGSLRSIRSIRSKLTAAPPLLLSSSCSGRYSAPLSKLFESRFCACKWFRLPGKHNNDKMCPLIKSNEDDNAYTIYIYKWVTHAHTINGRTYFYLLFSGMGILPLNTIRWKIELCAHSLFIKQLLIQMHTRSHIRAQNLQISSLKRTQN